MKKKTKDKSLYRIPYLFLRAIHHIIIKVLGRSTLTRILKAFWNIYNRVKWLYVDLAVIIWPPAHDCFNEIENDIKEDYHIHSVSQFEISKEKLEEFIVEVYKIDKASRKKIEKKIERLMKPPHVFRLIHIRIPFPKMVCQNKNNTWVRCKDINRLKIKIRNKYKNYISDYKYDVIIHSTEVTEHNYQLLELIEQYRESPLEVVRW